MVIAPCVEEETCKHHWLIESPSGPTSVGECKLCGELRKFRNSVGDTGWEKEPPAERALPRVARRTSVDAARNDDPSG